MALPNQGSTFSLFRMNSFLKGGKFIKEEYPGTCNRCPWASTSTESSFRVIFQSPAHPFGGGSMSNGIRATIKVIYSPGLTSYKSQTPHAVLTRCHTNKGVWGLGFGVWGLGFG